MQAGVRREVPHRRRDPRAGRTPGRRDRYCPRCRGVWLDRGELDKLIEKAPDTYESGPARGDFDRDRDRDRDRDGYRDDDDDRRRTHGQKRKKKGFLSEMFEFGE